ncbi:MAG: anti-sigma regulatory factor [Chloroflexota bacterium]|nr:anti-sigma regulatory factor [Anaerolineales bacterium]
MKALTIPGKLEFLPSVAEYVLQAATIAGLDYKTSYRLRLAVDEIATNIIIHGYHDQKTTGTIKMFAEVDDEYLTIYLEDDGTNYDPSEALPPDNIQGPAEERQVGGLGIFLALWGVDQFHYKQMHCGNCSTFKVNRKRRYRRSMTAAPARTHGDMQQAR